MFKQEPESPNRGKCSWTELPSDMCMPDAGEIYVGDSTSTDRDNLANNR